ncbi:hypothetical protein N8I77_013260 [Diaporthe amygdali]|uniref:Cytochrome P450 monooxygenase amyQ n=1 Tax=Phomopsis amygdali TaxID=1214568 RepID=AMYQ_PHOAM|nr:hypothetical protein N8I77_013260 [Diaporthe amygdali]
MISADWSTVDVLALSFKLVLRISQRILIGEPMSRDEGLLDCAQGYADAATVVQFTLKPLPRLLRPLIYHLLPASRHCKAFIRKTNKILAKELQRRRHLEQTDPSYKKPKDLLQGMVELDPCRSDDQFGHDFLVQALISRMAPVVTMAQALIDLSLQPEAIDELRKEIVQVMGQNGEGLSDLRKSLAKLDKMDSFIRESARMTPLSMMTMHRIVQDDAGITLHDGVHLPRGTHLALPAYNIGRDPAMTPNAEVFDGLRWYRQRQQNHQSSDEDSGGKWQFVTPDPNYLTFGSGKYVCPGRFIAAHMVKLMMVAVLSRYDVKRAPDAPKPTQKYLHVFSFPDQRTLLVKRRVGVDQVQII